MIACNSCKYWDREVDESPCDKCLHNAIDNFEPMTNFEKIKSMYLEELAEFICGIYGEEDGSKFINGITIPNFDEDAIQAWLKREVDE